MEWFWENMAMSSNHDLNGAPASYGDRLGIDVAREDVVDHPAYRRQRPARA